jgi:hypothetical protein
MHVDALAAIAAALMARVAINVAHLRLEMRGQFSVADDRHETIRIRRPSRSNRYTGAFSASAARSRFASSAAAFASVLTVRLTRRALPVTGSIPKYTWTRYDPLGNNSM